MKRKGLLKKLLGGVLCAAALISMSATVKAAEKEDLIGKWIGAPWEPVIFYENGTTLDGYGDTKPYYIKRGSLTVKDNDGNEQTLDYDLWNGGDIENPPNDRDTFAVLYKVIEPGKTMRAWNVFKRANDTDWSSYAPVTVTKVTDEKADTGSTDSASPVRGCDHNYEWTITTEPTETENGEESYMCTFCGDIKTRQPVSADIVIRKNLLASIKSAAAGTTISFSNKSWLCYPQYVLDALKEKGDISLKTDFTYEGINYSFTIPAGSDYSNLEQADFYGFMYLYSAFGGVAVE